MATSTKNVRIKVDLHEISITKDILCGTSWYLVDTSTLATIGDLKKDVITRYLKNASDVVETLTDVQITLDGILVPDWSGVNILRENDSIRFSFSEVDVKYADKKQKRKEKKKNKDQGTKTPVQFTEKHSRQVKKKNKKRKAEVSTDEGSQFSSKKKVKKQHKNIKSGEKTEVSAYESTNKVHNNLERNHSGASRKPVQNTSTNSSSSDSSETESQVAGNQANKLDGKKDRVHMPELDSNLRKKEIATKVTLQESNSNDCQLDSKSHPSNKKNNVAVGHHDGITKKHNVTESVSDSSDSSDSDPETGVTVMDDVTSSQIMVQQNVFSKNNSSHKGELDRSCEEGNKVEVIDTNSCSTDQGNVGMNSFDSKDAMNEKNREGDEKINTELGAEATKKRRRGKRVRSRKKKDNSVSGQICTTAPPAIGAKNVGFSLVDVNDKHIVSVLPVTGGLSHNALGLRNNSHVTMYNKSIKYNGDINTKHIKFGTDAEESADDEVNSNDVASTPVLDDPQISFNKCTPRLGEQNEATPTGGAQCETRVIQSKCELLSGAQVFTRTRNKKRGSFPLSKAQALSEQLTNKSFTFQNSEGGELVKKQKEPPSDSLQLTENSVVTTPTPDKPAVVVKNYEAMPRLYGAPRIGDRIAYKVLEMSQNYCPEVSAFKEAVVTSFDPQTSSVGLKLTATKEKSKRGRFDCVVEGEDFVLTNTETQAETQLTLDLNSLMETRLVTEDK